MSLLAFLLFISFAVTSRGSPSGAPATQEVCDNGLPNHGVAQQEGIPNFALFPSKTYVIGGEIITIELKPSADNSNKIFKGFFLHARTVDGESHVVGKFFADEDEPFNFRHCDDGINNTVTHFNNEPKQKISFTWRAPVDFDGIIQFRATVVEEKVVFWRHLMTQDILISSLDVPEPTIYNECGKSKSCFGLPSGCIDRRNCVTFGAVIVAAGTYKFEMQSSISASFIAMGLSVDDRMGSDSAIECVKKNDEVEAFISVTRAVPNNYGARRSEIDQTSIRLIEFSNNNGAIYCLVERAAVTEADGMTFDLSRAYFLLIASGSTAAELSIGYHDINRDVSSTSLVFTENGVVIVPMNKTPSRVLILLHGCFMVVAWIGATSLGVFSARYFKNLWTGKKIFGKDIWFVVHQVAMCLAWVLTISAVIIIIYDVGEWRTSTHSVLGIIATVLCFIQPLTAFFRPAPTDEARPIFNFMHGSIGKLAHLIAVTTIFFATSMARAELPDWTKYILISFVVVYLIFYAALTNLGIISDIKKRQMKGPEGHHNPPLTAVRRALFGLFTIIIVGFVVTLIIAVIDGTS